MYQGRERARSNPPLNHYFCPLTSIFEELESRLNFHQSVHLFEIDDKKISVFYITLSQQQEHSQQNILQSPHFLGAQQ